MRPWVRWLKFNGVGLGGIALQMAVLAALSRMGLGYLSATTIAVECAVLHNFFWHEHWTWRDRAAPGRRWSRLVRFHLANGAVSLAGNAALMWWLVGVLGGPLLISNLLSIAICGTANFLAGDLLVFRSAASRGGGAS